MTAQIIFGTDFKRSNPKADRAFWIGPDPLELMAIEIMNQALMGDAGIEFADTSPCEMAPDGDCG